MTTTWTSATNGTGAYAEVNGLRDGGWMGENRPNGGHALAILPGLTHYNLFASPLFAAVTLDLLHRD